MPRPLLLFACLLAFPAGAGAIACSSGSSGAGPDGGGDGAGGSSGGGVTGDSGAHLPVSDGGPCLATTAVPAAQIPGYAPVEPVNDGGGCSPTEITDFLAACLGGDAGPGGCSAFQNGGGSAGCLACLLARSGAGASLGGTLLDSTGNFIIGANTPGCIALVDTTGGAACAAGLEPLFQCESQACGSGDCHAADAATYEGCLSQSQRGACAAQYASSSPCTPDYEDGGAAFGAGRCATPAGVLEVICGTGK